MLVLHANGFNALTYRSLLAPLAAQLSIHIMALDMRGQGQSVGFANDPSSLRGYELFAEDVSQVLREHIDRPVLMAGHSMGGVVGLLAARRVPEKVSAYLGFDPVTVPGIIRILPRLPGGAHMLKNSFGWAKSAGHRRVKFESLEAAFVHYSGRGTFRFLPDEVTRDYLKGGIVKTDGGVMLSCDRLWEQAVYGAQDNDIYGAARHLPDNSRIIYAGKKPASTPLSRAKMRRIIGKDKVVYHSNYSHFFPLIRQKETRKFITQALGKAQS